MKATDRPPLPLGNAEYLSWYALKQAARADGLDDTGYCLDAPCRIPCGCHANEYTLPRTAPTVDREPGARVHA